MELSVEYAELRDKASLQCHVSRAEAHVIELGRDSAGRPAAYGAEASVDEGKL